MHLGVAKSIVPWLLALGAAFPARAAVEASLGLVDEIDGRQTSMVAVAWVGGETAQWELMLGTLDDRERNGSGDVATPTTTFISASRRLYLRQHWYFGSGIALADTDGDNPVLSGPVQFMTSLGWRGDVLTLSLRHLSNANTRGKNRGETFLLIGYHW